VVVPIFVHDPSPTLLIDEWNDQLAVERKGNYANPREAASRNSV
jgi:hypothetical protein